MSTQSGLTGGLGKILALKVVAISDCLTTHDNSGVRLIQTSTFNNSIF